MINKNILEYKRNIEIAKNNLLYICTLYELNFIYYLEKAIKMSNETLLNLENSIDKIIKEIREKQNERI